MPNNVFNNIPYAKWLEETLKDLITFPVKGICMFATDGSGNVYTNYHNISTMEMLTISGVVQQDAMIDRLVTEGILNYADEEDEDGEEKEG